MKKMCSKITFGGNFGFGVGPEKIGPEMKMFTGDHPKVVGKLRKIGPEMKMLTGNRPQVVKK